MKRSNKNTINSPQSEQLVCTKKTLCRLYIVHIYNRTFLLGTLSPTHVGVSARTLLMGVVCRVFAMVEPKYVCSPSVFLGCVVNTKVQLWVICIYTLYIYINIKKRYIEKQTFEQLCVFCVFFLCGRFQYFNYY